MAKEQTVTTPMDEKEWMKEWNALGRMVYESSIKIGERNVREAAMKSMEAVLCPTKQ